VTLAYGTPGSPARQGARRRNRNHWDPVGAETVSDLVQRARIRGVRGHKL